MSSPVLIDERIARAVARRVAGAPPQIDPGVMARLRSDLDDAVARSERLVSEASGIPAPAPVQWGVIDRPTWAELNISGMANMLAPLADKLDARMSSLPWVARVAQRGLVSLEIGALLGYMSRRVLGQYDLLVPGEATRSTRRALRRATGKSDVGDGALYFVGPNLIDMQRRFDLVPDEFALWVAVHEMTHRFQFAGVPWLRETFLSLVHGYLDSVDLDVRGFAQRLKGAVARLLSKDTPVEERNPVYLLASDEQRALLDRLQALMAVVEGHGNFVMDSVGAEVIPSFARMRAIFESRRKHTNAVQRAVNHLIGLEMKLRQYELGQEFCNEIARRGGLEAVRGMWSHPDNLPTMAELRDPSRWLQRVAA